jgi:hypothetical protein
MRSSSANVERQNVMKNNVKQFKSDTLWVGTDNGGPGKMHYQELERSDIIGWASEPEKYRVELGNVLHLANRYVRDHDLSGAIKQDIQIILDPKSSDKAVEDAEARITGVYKFDWTSERGRRKSKWGELAPYIPAARKQLGSAASDGKLRMVAAELMEEEADKKLWGDDYPFFVVAKKRLPASHTQEDLVAAIADVKELLGH